MLLLNYGFAYCKDYIACPMANKCARSRIPDNLLIVISIKPNHITPMNYLHCQYFIKSPMANGQYVENTFIKF